ncbi:MAG: adenylate/guanylate cyclase domain-containing protein [Solirubrobacteraceae bacterium]
MLDRLARRLYLRLGQRYKLVFLVTQQPSGIVVATVAVLLMTSFYSPSVGQSLVMIAGACGSTVVALGYALWKGVPYLERVVEWQGQAEPSAAVSIAAWDAATNFPMRSFRATALYVGAIAALPSTALIVLTLHLGVLASPVLLAAAILPVGYGTIINYFIAELLMRPVIEDIAAGLPEDFPFTTNGLLIRKRLKILLPIFTAFVGLVVAALMTGHGGTKMLGLSLLAAVGVGLLLSTELTVFLSRSVTGPIASLRVGLAGVRGGDYSVRVPVVTTDELGELSHDFNLMALGLQERERMREAFGTYLDHDIVPLILSGQFPKEGVEVTVSIMFVDVRDFTAFAEGAQPTEVIASLNSLFEVIVPIVTAHGGHVDKFLGDGLLAVFGAPEGYEDHADRAVAAGEQIVCAVNRPDAELRVGVGINTGAVVAGSIGGAGRLNFSVIGDPVNVSARVEAATRETGDDLLMTTQTRDALRRPLELISRGTVALKGKAEPVEVLACARIAERHRSGDAFARYTA